MTRRALLLAGVLAAGCGSVAPVPPDVFIRLDVPPPAAPVRSPWTGGVIRVAPLVASGLHKERALAITRDAGQSLAQAHHQLWIDPPERMLQHELARYLRAAAVASSIGTGPAVDTALAVSGRILRFEQEIEPGAMKMRVHLELSASARGKRGILTREYAASAPLDDATAGAAARAMNRAVGDVFAAFVRDAGSAFPGPETAGKPAP
ncbi:MAG: ABC-type transport auxiliary lipoprotein family protein [Gammaproteobacteria bacterium]